MISAFSVNASMPSVSYRSAIISSGLEKIYVPVRPSNVIYTQFDHVAGVAARPNQAGVTVSKVQILNSLIDQLVSMKSNPVNAKKAVQEMPAKQIDVLINDYQAMLKTTMQMAQATGYGLSGATPSTGVLFAIDA